MASKKRDSDPVPKSKTKDAGGGGDDCDIAIGPEFGRKPLPR
jgi:hypothetical protein